MADNDADERVAAASAALLTLSALSPTARRSAGPVSVRLNGSSYLEEGKAQPTRSPRYRSRCCAVASGKAPCSLSSARFWRTLT
jgi:hypothetical protein